VTLEKIALTNFRNYTERSFAFPPGLTVIVGPNTVGKTNLLEAIYLLSTGKSLRALLEAEMICWGAKWSRVEGFLSPTPVRETTGEVDLGVDLAVSSEIPAESRDAESLRLEVFLAANSSQTIRKEFKVNGIKRSAEEFQGMLRVVIFSPENLKFILGSPSVRRSYLDRVLSGLDRDYTHALVDFQKVVKSRNQLLWMIRERGIPRDRLEFWDKKLFDLGRFITARRRELLVALNKEFNHLGRKLSLVYEPSLLDQSRYEERLALEIERAMTLWGPHRDDFRFVLGSGSELAEYTAPRNDHGGFDLAIYGSRGEQREAVFSLCLAELELVSTRSGERPLLLLDDIFSELDLAHRRRVLEILPEQQTLVTSAEPELLNSGLMRKAQVIELE